MTGRTEEVALVGKFSAVARLKFTPTHDASQAQQPLPNHVQFHGDRIDGNDQAIRGPHHVRRAQIKDRDSRTCESHLVPKIVLAPAFPQRLEPLVVASELLGPGDDPAETLVVDAPLIDFAMRSTWA